MSNRAPREWIHDTSSIKFDRCLEIRAACDRIWSAGLFVNDEATSHIMEMVRPCEPDEHGQWGLQAIWLAVDSETGKDVGVAVISDGPFANGYGPVLNIYVHPDHQGRGIGSGLVERVVEHFPDVYANYTLDSVRIYRRKGLRPANIPYDQSSSSCIASRRQSFIDAIERARQEYDEGAARLAPPAFRP